MDYVRGGLFAPLSSFPNLPTASATIVGSTLTYTGTPAAQQITVLDNDANFDDGDAGDQTLTSAITLEGQVIVAGTSLIPEYSYTLRPAGGTAADDIVIHAFEVGINDVVGFLTSAPLVVGVAYEIVDTANTSSVPYDTVVPCFARGTRIGTEFGPVPVEDLAPGDRVVTQDNGLQELRWGRDIRRAR